MKRLTLIVFCVTFITLLPAREEKFFVSAGSGVTLPSDSRYRDYYGTVQFSPELKAGFVFFKRFYVWLGYDFFFARYTVPVLLEKISGNQHSLALGAGWETRRGRRLQADFFAALTLAGFSEKGLGETVADSAPGYAFGTGVRYFFCEKYFLGVAVSYSHASISLNDTDVTIAGRYLLGGLRLGTHLGIRF